MPRSYSNFFYKERIGEREVVSKFNPDMKWNEPIYKNKKMKIRIMSDLHLDYNNKHPLVLEDKDTFTIIAGDLSGYSKHRDEWLKENIRNGVFIEGNHIFYNDENKSLQQHYGDLQKKYPLESNVSFLQNEHKIINDIVFVGCTLWTDCRLYGKKYTTDLPKRMNDYRYGKYSVGNKKEHSPLKIQSMNLMNR